MEEQDKKIGMNKTITLLRARGVEIMDVQFLWFPYIPEGMITFLEGDPGVGKSWISIKLASDLSNGVPLPGQKEKEKVPPRNVLMFTGEEPLEAMRSRLDKVGADPNYVWLSDSIFPLNKKGLEDFQQVIQELDAKLVFLDPLQSFITSDADINNAKDMQKMLQPIAKIARETKTSIVIIRHLRKSGGKNAKHAGIGSIALTGIARSVIQANETRGGNHIMSHVKHNYSDRGDTLHYSFGNGAFKWEGTWSDKQNSQGDDVKISRGPNKNILKTQEWLWDALRDGAKPMVDLLVAGAEAGLKESWLKEAKKGVAISRRINNVWYWELKERAGEGEKPSLKLKTQRTPEENAAIEAHLAKTVATE